MQIFNIGPLEILLILAIALIVLGPEEMLNTARKLARLIQKFIKSPVWKSLVNTSQEIRSLPKKFMAEAGLDETVKELNKMNQQVKDFTRMNPLEPGKHTPETSQPVASQPVGTEPSLAAAPEKIIPPAAETQVEPGKPLPASNAENPEEKSENTGDSGSIEKNG